MRASTKKDWTPEEDRRITEMRQNHSIVEIADALGVSSAQVAYRITMLGLPHRSKVDAARRRFRSPFRGEYPFLAEGHVAADQFSFYALAHYL